MNSRAPTAARKPRISATNSCVGEREPPQQLAARRCVASRSSRVAARPRPLPGARSRMPSWRRASARRRTSRRAQPSRRARPAGRSDRRTSRRARARARRSRDAAVVAVDVLQHATGPAGEADPEDRADVRVGDRPRTPSSRHLIVSIDSMNSIRSSRSLSGIARGRRRTGSTQALPQARRACRPRSRRSRRRRALPPRSSS